MTPFITSEDRISLKESPFYFNSILASCFHGPGPGPDGPGCQQTTETNLGFHAEQPLFNKALGPSLLSAYTWLPLTMDMAQMCMDSLGCSKKLKTSPFLYGKQHLFQQLCPEIKPCRHPCSRLTPGCLWPWAWPRWSWMSGKTLNQPSFTC